MNLTTAWLQHKAQELKRFLQERRIQKALDALHDSTGLRGNYFSEKKVHLSLPQIYQDLPHEVRCRISRQICDRLNLAVGNDLFFPGSSGDGIQISDVNGLLKEGESFIAQIARAKDDIQRILVLNWVGLDPTRPAPY